MKRVRIGRIKELPVKWSVGDECGLRTRTAENAMFVCLAHTECPLIIDPAGRGSRRTQFAIEGVLIHDLDAVSDFRPAGPKVLGRGRQPPGTSFSSRLAPKGRQ